MSHITVSWLHVSPPPHTVTEINDKGYNGIEKPGKNMLKG